MNSYITSVKKQFVYYKSLGDKTFNQLSEEDFFWQYNDASNSVAILVKHIAGNMLSRWTHFFTEDGEKDWRHRDDEFNQSFATKKEVITYWEKGWNCLFTTINSLKEEDLECIIYIRNQGHTVVEAINRQLSHYPYHIGQMVFLAKMLTNNNWQTLSIAKGNSKTYNADKFSKEKSTKHFTDDV